MLGNKLYNSFVRLYVRIISLSRGQPIAM